MAAPFNIDKCKVLHIGSKDESKVYSMSRDTMVPIEETKLEKDLGIQVDPKLQFSQHIQAQVAKANRILGLIRRTFTYIDCPMMKLLFASLVRPHLEYLVSVWNPLWIKDQIAIESVLRRATRVIPGMKELTYEERLKKINLPSMHYRRLRGDMIEVWKYLHNKYKVDYSSNWMKIPKCEGTVSS